MISLLIPVFAAPLAGLASDPGDENSAATISTGSSKASTGSSEAQPFRDMRATKLIGMDVKNLAGEDLGEIKDLIVDLENERVYYAVLSFGGFLGLGDKLFAYPVRAFKGAADDDVLMLNVSEEKLKAAPGFDAGKDPADWNQYRAEVDRYFGPTTTVKPMANQQLRRASYLIGKDVNDPAGTDVGDIEDIVVNMTNGRIRYVVLDFDKAWSLDDKLMPVQMSALTTTPNREELVINVDKSTLDSRLAFNEDRWPW